MLRAVSERDLSTLTEICAATGLSKSTAHRILSGLVAEQFLARTSDKRYTAGKELIINNYNNLGRLELIDRLVAGRLKELASSVRLTTSLTVTVGFELFYAHRARSSFGPEDHARGMRMPVGLNAPGIVQLAQASEAYKNEALSRILAHTSLDRDDILSATRRAQEAGYSEFPDYLLGTCGIAVAIISSWGELLGSISVPLDEARNSEKPAVVVALQRGAADLAKRFSASPYFRSKKGSFKPWV